MSHRVLVGWHLSEALCSELLLNEPFRRIASYKETIWPRSCVDACTPSMFLCASAHCQHTYRLQYILALDKCANIFIDISVLSSMTPSLNGSRRIILYHPWFIHPSVCLYAFALALTNPINFNPFTVTMFVFDIWYIHSLFRVLVDNINIGNLLPLTL